MRCEFCAEEIQDAAILCRFCGARKTEGQWLPPGFATPPVFPGPSITPPPKGRFTILTAGWFFAVSAAMSLIWISSPVPLLGAMRDGAPAIIYNLIFGVTFTAMAIGLIRREPWGFQATVVGTVLYSLDRLQFVLDKATRDAYLAASNIPKDVNLIMDPAILHQSIILMALGSLLCWWGFVPYLYWRRAYFRAR